MKSRRENILSFIQRISGAASKPPEGRLIGFCGILLCFIVSPTSLAQVTNDGSTANPAVGSGSSNIEIIKLEWKREVRLPRNFDPAVISTGGTFNDPATRISSTSPTTAAVESARASGPRGGTDNASGTFPATPSRLPVFYVYSMKIKNVGPKQIEGVAWDYLFIDSNLKSEVGRHQFLTYTKIPNNKISTLHADLRTPPVSVVGAPLSGTSKHSRYSEKAVLQCVLYEDASVWKNPLAKTGVCEFLKSKYPTKQRHASGQSQ